MSRYGLGIDIGAGTVSAAVRAVEDMQPGGPPQLLIRDAGRDVEVPLRLVLARLGDPTPFAGTSGEPRTAAQHLATLVAGVREEVGSAQGAAPGHTVVSVPPSWGDHRRAVLDRALAEAIGGSCTLASSAVSAARRHRADSGGGPVAVFDLGAATVDTAVVRTTDDGGLEHVVVPPAPVRWGGRDIDDALLQHVCAAVGLPGPSGAAPGRGRARLDALRAACTAAKERLSSELAVRVDVDHPEEYVRLVRADLDELIAGSITESVAALRAAIHDAGLTPEDLDGVVLAGGGALVPLVAATLSAELDVRLLITDEPAGTVAEGAAELAADLLAVQQAAADGAAPATGDATADADVDVEAEVVDLAAHRHRRRSQAGVRTGVVAALLAVLLVAPLSLMDALHGGVRTRSAPGAAVAGEPSTSAPAPAAPAPAAPAEAATPDPGAESATAPPATRSTAPRWSSTDEDVAARSTAPSTTGASTAPGTTTANSPAPGTTTPPTSSSAAAPAVTTAPPTTGAPTSSPPPNPPPTTENPAPPPTTQDPAPPPTTENPAPPPTTENPAPPPTTENPAPPPATQDPAPPPSDAPPPDGGGAGDGAA